MCCHQRIMAYSETAESLCSTEKYFCTEKTNSTFLCFSHTEAALKMLMKVQASLQKRINKESNGVNTFFGLNSTSVILEGSTMGLGLRRFSIRLCHWVGKPTKQPRLASNEVWTRCSKFLGADISGLFFFFLRNIVRSRRATVCLI